MADQLTIPDRRSDLPIRTLKIDVVKGPDAGKSVVARGDSVTIGTAKDNDLELSDETVSRYHVEISRQGNRIVVQDHGSTNGTTAGAVTIERATVAAGTVLSLGRTQIKVGEGDTVQLELHGEDRFGRLRGRTAEMRALMAKIERAAKSDVSVLLLGETGTGKEVIARALHEASPRAKESFETVDCGALLPTLIASELFGHEKGAFTGADRQSIGAFERADGGTLFLDEIGELPAAVQAALLGALERRSFRRLGGQQQIAVNVRVVCATHRDLRSEVNAGTFRQDLYYRIAVLMLRVPPLRDRKEDIPLLIEHFLRESGYRGDVDEIVPASAMDTLRQHHWPGNVRELRNFVEASLAMGETPPIEADMPAPAPRSGASGAPAAAAREEETGLIRSAALQQLSELPYNDARASLVREFEVAYLRALLKRTKGNVSKASREAKMDRSHLRDMLNRLEIE